MERWPQHFGAYEREVEGQPARYVVDLAALAHAPVASHPLRVQIALAIGARDAAGRPAPEDAARLEAIEDVLVELLETQADAIYVGRRVDGDAWTLVCYAPPEHRGDLLALPGRIELARTARWSLDDDPAWSGHAAMQPEPHVRQAIENQRLVARYAAEGDALARPRPIDHLAYFASEAAAQAAAAALTAAGFRCDEVEGDRDDDDDRECWSLEFHRSDPLDGDHPDRFTRQILDVLIPLGGSYDGWTALVVPIAE
ncbi:MAG: DUF695 domain-containing protein [Myxococcales bacterium]|nr:DUF695 domain-containing protein [Myxococcales bacterium]